MWRPLYSTETWTVFRCDRRFILSWLLQLPSTNPLLQTNWSIHGVLNEPCRAHPQLCFSEVPYCQTQLRLCSQEAFSNVFVYDYHLSLWTTVLTVFTSDPHRIVPKISKQSLLLRFARHMIILKTFRSLTENFRQYWTQCFWNLFIHGIPFLCYILQ